MTTKRESGYYWIKFKTEDADPSTEMGWEVAYYDNSKDREGWYSIWEGGSYTDDEIDFINEKRLFPFETTRHTYPQERLKRKRI